MAFLEYTFTERKSNYFLSKKFISFIDVSIIIRWINDNESNKLSLLVEWGSSLLFTNSPIGNNIKYIIDNTDIISRILNAL